MTDPYLLSSGGGPPALAALTRRTRELACRMHVPGAMLDGMPPGALDQLEQTAARIEASQQTWGDLAGSIAHQLTAAGFRQHEPYGQRGGFHLSLWEDGVLLAWSTTEYPADSASPFEKTVEHAMHPALEQILRAAGFKARILPEDHDNAGSIQVTGCQG